MPSPPPVYCTASLAHPRRRRRNQLLPLRTHLSFSSSLNEPFSPFQIRHSGERGISLHSLGGGAAYNQDRQRHTAPSKREGGRTHFLPFLCDGDGSPRSPFSPLIPGYTQNSCGGGGGGGGGGSKRCLSHIFLPFIPLSPRVRHKRNTEERRNVRFLAQSYGKTGIPGSFLGPLSGTPA